MLFVQLLLATYILQNKYPFNLTVTPSEARVSYILLIKNHWVATAPSRFTPYHDGVHPAIRKSYHVSE